ncbi:TPA: ferredoxin [bacterium]|nr:MAG: hypothetical protein AUJ18_05715 [Candidatus Hydrogenedentes bacterium CG1_02_42_14]PIU47801.1 MAG: ferredoxin [Candidatus Hydrogenedentes bacterium CG07_land_8_20_14_0_80_42_17]HBW46797.1 ferredoxin [bacterium]
MRIDKGIEKEALIDIAMEACLAAKTAPKAKGKDLISFIILSEDDKDKFAEKMERLSIEYNHKGFLRDSKNILQAQALILIGTKMERLNLSPCGMCGYKDCEENERHNSLCAYAPGDLGIAIGSLVSILADHRVDNRIMYTAGVTALKEKIFPSEIRIAYGIPLSATGKSPFFDRPAM